MQGSWGAIVCVLSIVRGRAHRSASTKVSRPRGFALTYHLTWRKKAPARQPSNLVGESLSFAAALSSLATVLAKVLAIVLFKQSVLSAQFSLSVSVTTDQTTIQEE